MSEEMILSLLYLRDHLFLSATQAAQRMGVSRNAVLGIWRRIDEANARHPERVGDGDMAPLWWQRDEDMAARLMAVAR